MTHEGILKVNEFFNNKLAKATDNIRISITYIGNFGNQNLFQNLRKVIRRIGYEDVKGQIDTLYCLVDSIKRDDISDAIVTAALSGSSKSYLPVKDTIEAFKDTMSQFKITFDDRLRRDNGIALYLTSTHFCIKTNFYTVSQHRDLYKKFIKLLISIGLFIPKEVEYKIDSADLYHQVYNNAKSVISNMNSRGMSIFAIACYFWLVNKKFTPKPFMNEWSGVNFIQALITTPLYKNEADERVKTALKNKPYWTVLSETSLLTGKIANIDERRKALNTIINKVLNSQGEEYIKHFLKQLKLVGSQNPIASQTISIQKDPFRTIEKSLQEELKSKSTKIPSKEEILLAIKYQFMISRVLDIDFSSKRKDHIVFDKATKKRVFDIL